MSSSRDCRWCTGRNSSPGWSGSGRTRAGRRRKVQPGPEHWFDDPAFSLDRKQRFGNPLAIVRPAPGTECAEVRLAADVQEPVVACLAAGSIIGRAPTPLGVPGETTWYAVFQPELVALCNTAADCLPETIGFVDAQYLDPAS